MASRGTLDVLESIPLNTLHDAHPPAKKRKTSHVAVGGPAGSAIVIRAHATSLSDEPFVLDPITVLPSSRVPFSWLDTSYSTLSPIQSGSLFVAEIPVLENGQQARAIGPTVLAVRLMSYNRLYLVERVKRGIYALSRLGPWVGEGEIFVAGKGWTASASGISDERITAPYQSPFAAEDDAVEWWQSALVEDPVVGVGGIAAGRTGKIDISVAFFDAKDDNRRNYVSPASVVESQAASIARTQSQAIERSSSSDVNMPSATVQNTQEQSDSIDNGAGNEFNNQVDDLQSPQELLDGLREQYLQALYISKTSLAYFAKGPLTRCRNAFRYAESTSSKKPIDLVGFYREAILPAKKMDLKYRETLPPTIRDAMLILSDDETAQKKKRKSRKKKLGKDGLYPGEGDLICRWWKDRSLSENGTMTEIPREAEMKKHVADLRLRETQLQILLILETMALESTIANDTKIPRNGENGDKPAEEPAKKPKSKKPQDLNVVLELHLDRLCIWHAVSFDELAIPDSIKDTESNHLSGKKAESDAVRDFCTEVIVPFYASRLPDKCKLITRKFGVSSSTNSAALKQPQVKKAPRESTAKRQQQQEQQKQAQKPRRTLQRVLTDEQSASQGRHPSLKRHKTAPSKPDGMRDSMEPLLPAVSANVRGGIQKAKRVENREVDLNAAARQHETKLRKVQLLVDQKKELDAAIHTLRRPNRELVAKDIADDADKRSTSGGGSARKQKNPVRNPLGQGVQVMATPKGSRKKDATASFDLPPPPLPRSISGPSVGHLMNAASSSPPSGGNADAQMVPNSAVRSGLFSGPRLDHGDMGAVQETPTRRPARSVEPSAKSTGRTNYTSGNLFRVPSRPSDKSTEIVTPSKPVSTRRTSASMPVPTSNPAERIQVKSSTITETPPKRQSELAPISALAINSASSAYSLLPPPSQPPPESLQVGMLSTPVKGDAVQVTPVKKITAGLGGVPSSTSASAECSATVPMTPEKSIYEQLGWSDDDELGL